MFPKNLQWSCMTNKNSSKILERASSSISVKIKPNGTITLPKSWIKDIFGSPALITKIDDVLVITPRKVQPDYSVDERVWKKIKPTLRKIRKQLFKERYPQLYASLQKKRVA